MNYKVSLSTKINPGKLSKGSGIIAIEPGDYTASQVKAIKAKGYKVLAYLSIGTIEKERSWFKKYKSIALKRLKDWPNEYYADVRKKAWRSFLLSRAQDLKKHGYDGFWCDNLDVYEYYPSDAMFESCLSVLGGLKKLGYVMVNGGSALFLKAIKSGYDLKKYVNGITQEEVFSRITNYSGNGKFAKQTSTQAKWYRAYGKKIMKVGVPFFCLEYTRDEALKKTIKTWCQKYGASACISGKVNL